MRILVVGANGFIGSYITAKLLKDNQSVVCAVRDVESTKRKFPNVEVVHCDFNTDVKPGTWLERLKNIDVVINVAGLLTSVGENNIENVHVNGPKALFDACVQAKINKIIHISALGIDDEKTTDYALTKKAADNYLKTLENIDWVILQPSLIYASGCYGGTSLFRALASLPYFIPLVGDGMQKFQPIHVDDLTEVVLYCVKKEDVGQRVLKLVGPEIVTVKDILISFRRWLGLAPAKLIKIPLIFIKIGAKFGDVFGVGPLNSTAYKMMLQPNIADQDELTKVTGIKPRNFEQGLTTEPLTIQSLWHAKLFFLKPLLKLSLGLFWIGTGLITSMLATDLGLKNLMELGFSKQMASNLLYSSCVLDIILGVALVIKQRVAGICLVQILVITGYTLLLTVLKPQLWLDPFGVLTKNIPIILVTLVLMAIDRDK